MAFETSATLISPTKLPWFLHTKELTDSTILTPQNFQRNSTFFPHSVNMLKFSTIFLHFGHCIKYCVWNYYGKKTIPQCGKTVEITGFHNNSTIFTKCGIQ